MAQDITVFLTGLAVLALMIERIVEKFLGWIPNKIEKGGYILTSVVFLIGVIIAYFGDILVLNELFLKAVPKLLDSIITGLFIAAGADPIHQVIRLLEEKKEQAKAEMKKKRGK